MIKVIKTDKEYEDALAQVETLIDIDPDPGTPEGDQLELLSLLISKYEDEKYQLDLPDPLEAIKFRMEQQNLTRKDLIPYFGNASKLSEVFSGKRPLTLKMMRALHKNLGISAEVLLKGDEREVLDEYSSIEWLKFPINEMVKRKWFENYSGTVYEAKDRAEELLRDFMKPVVKDYQHPAFFRNNRRLNSAINEYALFAWIVKVLRVAQPFPFSSEYDSSSVKVELMKDIVKLSYLKDGPKLAIEYLAKKGIFFVCLQHLPQTHLDGASLRLQNGHPVIALTLRHDRLDNFWFTLCHELAHIILHFDEGKEFYFIDDFDVKANEIEAEADQLAQEVLIPSEYWKPFKNVSKVSTDQILSVSEELRIHPSIIAGRIRKERNNYRIFSRLVGSGQVRKMLCEN